MVLNPETYDEHTLTTEAIAMNCRRTHEEARRQTKEKGNNRHTNSTSYPKKMDNNSYPKKMDNGAGEDNDDDNGSHPVVTNHPVVYSDKSSLT